MALKVKDLIRLLERADPEALVFDEFEGDFSEMEEGDIRVGDVSLIDIYVDRKTDVEFLHWTRDSHPYITDQHRPAKQRCRGVLLGVGQSENQWPEFLKDEPSR